MYLEEQDIAGLGQEIKPMIPATLTPIRREKQEEPESLQEPQAREPQVSSALKLAAGIVGVLAVTGFAVRLIGNV